MAYDSDKLSVCGQAIAGPRKFVYDDTGGEAVSVYEGAGYFANAKKFGAVAGDPIEVINRASDIVYSGRFTTVQDTGGTSGTVTLDTGPDIPG